ncbi:MAG: hypothetical protein KAI61_03875 [Alphaproteobacteria bacterium]|nr:hypothetical protein [Alphaproteobacteria bacterium]
MDSKFKNLRKLAFLLGLYAFIGLIIGQFLAMPFLMLSRGDPGISEISGNIIFGRMAMFIYPFCAAIGFFVGVHLAQRKKVETPWFLICLLFALSVLIFYPGSQREYYDLTAYRDAVVSFLGYLSGAGICMPFFLIKRKKENV